MDMSIVDVMCISHWHFDNNGTDCTYTKSISKFKGKDWRADQYGQGPDNLCGSFWWTKEEIVFSNGTEVVTVWYGSKTPIMGWNRPDYLFEFFCPICSYMVIDNSVCPCCWTNQTSHVRTYDLETNPLYHSHYQEIPF